MNRKKLLISLAMVMLSMAGLAADNLPALRVQGKNLVDANGKTVVLHGVMDTPNRYFNGWRWQQWKADYTDADVKPCLDYFEKIFTAITDHSQGAYCDVFRLHMDPCWTNGTESLNSGYMSYYEIMVPRLLARQISPSFTYLIIRSISSHSIFRSSSRLWHTDFM